jgi:PKD repeat protein
VSFYASTSSAGSNGETLTSYAWDFGDGATGSGATTTHTYAGTGPYTVRLTVTNSGGQTDSLSLQVSQVASAFIQPSVTGTVNFTLGRMVADPVRDLVYLADQTDPRILAVDTDLGQTAASRSLSGEPGALAVSPDGSQLFVAEPNAFQIEVLSLPSLAPVTILPVGFEVDNLACTVNGHLFVSTPAGFFGDAVDELDAQTGSTLRTLPTHYASPLLRTNSAGTTLYIREDDSGSGGNGDVDAYDVSGSGQPTKTATYPAEPQANSQDFLVNESAGRVYAMDYGTNGIGVTDVASGGQTTWNFNGVPDGLAVAALPSGPVYGGTDSTIFQFSPSGIVEATYPVPQGLMSESLKITPNGHLLYGNVTGDNTSELGIIGLSGLAIDTFPNARFIFAPGSAGQVTFNAGASSPGPAGQTITHYAWSFGDGTTGSGVTVTHTFTGAGPFTVQLTITNSSGLTDEVSHEVAQLTSALPQPTAIADVSFALGRMVADPVHNLVYAADQTNNRVLAVDTDLGRTAASRTLASMPGALAVSLYGDRLFVAEPRALQIQVFSLPALNPLTTLHVGIAIGNMVAVANDRLVISTPGANTWNDIDELDAETGKKLTTISSGSYYGPLLRTNGTGTDLYVRETGLSGPPSNIDEYDVSGQGPITRVNGYLAPLENSLDFVVNESAHRIYTADGGVYGVGVTDMDTNATTVLSFGGAPYGIGVAALATGPIYGASIQGVVEFDAGGIMLAQYPLAGYNSTVMTESLKITPNGHLLYGIGTGNDTSELGIIGAPSLVVDDVPVARFTFTPGSGGQVSFNATTSTPGGKHETITGYAWNFGDGTIGKGALVTHTFAGPGPYNVTLTVTSSAKQTDAFSLAVLGGSISGTVYNDRNKNGARGSGEGGLAGWIVYLDVNQNGQYDPGELTARTTASGSFVFTGLTEGVTYHVAEIGYAGWHATTPTQIDVRLTAGKRVQAIAFGDTQMP